MDVEDEAMPGPKTRPVGSGEGLVPLQGTVPKEIRERYKAVAAESGVSVSYYLEKLAVYLDEQGAWPAIAKPLPRAEMLDLDSLEATTAAA